MTSNEMRADTLVRALRAAVDGDIETIAASCTDDIRAWTPALSTSSLAELIDELGRRDDVFSNVELEVAPLDVGGDFACVEWTVTMTRPGTTDLADETVEPTELQIKLHGVTIAEFAGDRICSLRQYWDESAILEQLGGP